LDGNTTSVSDISNLITVEFYDNGYWQEGNAASDFNEVLISPAQQSPFVRLMVYDNHDCLVRPNAELSRAAKRLRLE
jgi:hypothetical protein